MADDSNIIPGTLVISPNEPRGVIMRPERTPVVSYVPVFDTARFEHYGRVATVMAETGMLPETLTHEGKGDNAKMLPGQVIKARAFMIVELADRWNASPFALMMSCSFVHGKLMLEGKVVHGAVEANIGVNLQYQFGRYDLKKEVTIVGEEGEGDLLGVRVIATLPGETEPRFVDGSVGIWKTTGSGSPWKPGAMKRQCRYRGAREWTRAYKPSLLAGIITDDEIESIVDRQGATSRQRGERVDLRGKLKGPAEGGEGFSQDHVKTETAGRVIDAEAKVVEAELKVGGEPGEAAGPEREADAGNAQPAQNAGEASASSDSATPASGASPDQKGPGQPDSSSKPDAGSEAKPQEQEKPKQTRAKAKAEPDPAPAADEDPVEAFIESLAGMSKWAEEIKMAYFALRGLPEWKTATEERRHDAAIAVCERIWELGIDLAPHEDPSFFTAWCTYQLDRGERPACAMLVGKELALLKETDAFKALKEVSKTGVENYANTVIGTTGAGLEI